MGLSVVGSVLFTQWKPASAAPQPLWLWVRQGQTPWGQPGRAARLHAVPAQGSRWTRVAAPVLNIVENALSKKHEVRWGPMHCVLLLHLQKYRPAPSAAFLVVFHWTASPVPQGRREGRAKAEDSLFLGWLSPTPWHAGCQWGGVAGRCSPVCNTAPGAGEERRFEPPSCRLGGSQCLSRSAVSFHLCICLFPTG